MKHKFLNMINIEQIKCEYENGVIWVNIRVFSNIDQKSFSKIIISSENVDYISDEYKLSKGINHLEYMINKELEPWFPNGSGNINVYDIKAEIFFNEEYSSIRDFIVNAKISYENNSLCVNDFYPLIFGVSGNMITIPQIDTAFECDINTLFTNDTRKEIIDYCKIKGIVLLPFEVPNCSNIEAFRKDGKKIIIDINDLNIECKKYLSPIYIGKDFISNNTNNYLYGTLSIGQLNTITNTIEKETKEDISIEEFTNISYKGFPRLKNNYISFANIWNKNIIAKHIEYKENTEFSKGNILLSKFKIDENNWVIVFSSNEFIPNLNIITENTISKNNFDIFPGESVEVLFSEVNEEPEFELKSI